jgi:N-acetylglucosamine kinase-like BadF-type ATPase
VPFFLGIDGGGTKTRCIVGDEKSHLGTGSSASCRVQKVGEASARDSLSAAIHQACVQADVSPRQIASTCAGITGAARAEICGVMRNLIASLIVGEIDVVGDTEIAFEDAFGAGSGVIVIAGTGAIVYGRDGNGESARASGWGPAVSDEGSGYWIGTEAVRSALRARDGGESSGLLNDLMGGLGANGFDDFIVRVNATPTPDFSILFPVVTASAENGDLLATELLRRAGKELAKSAGVVIDRLFPAHSCPVATHGGVFAGSSIAKKSFVDEVSSRSRRITLVDKPVDPARGALELARRKFKNTGT